MTKTKPGDRVGAIISIAEGKATIAGYGVYDGEHPVPEEIDADLAKMKLKNPKITLDDGNVIWGCECYWGSESSVKATLDRLGEGNTVQVSIEQLRAANKAILEAQ